MKKGVQEYITELLSLFKRRFPQGYHKLELNSEGKLFLWIHFSSSQGVPCTFDEPEELTPQETFEGIIKSMIEAGYISSEV